LLSQLLLLQESDGRVAIAGGMGLDSEDWVQAIRWAVAGHMCSLLAREELSRAVQYRQREQEVWVDSLLLPGSDVGLPVWVVDFGVASRESLLSRFWLVDKSFHQLFLDAIRSVNDDRATSSQGLTLDQLIARRHAQEEAGRAAEEWVLGYERIRLAGHPLLDQVRRVSELDVTLGFDILSFSSLGVLAHDLFVEVKSYEGDITFFWSRNEIDVAKKIGEAYCLYLVDRRLMSSRDYVPMIVSDPYAVVFMSDEPRFQATPETFYVVPIKSDRPSLQRGQDGG
jgi:hypothetical protein